MTRSSPRRISLGGAYLQRLSPLRATSRLGVAAQHPLDEVGTKSIRHELEVVEETGRRYR